MPTFNKKTSPGERNEWYIRKNTSNLSSAPPVSTFQVEPEGRDMLLDLNLAHAAEPNRKADLDDDLFYLLDDLGLLSKKGDGPGPGDALSSSPGFKRLTGLSDAQRARLARSLLRRFSLRELCQHEHVFEFFVGLDSLPDDARLDLLDRLLEATPFDAWVIDAPADALDSYADFLYEDDAEFYNPVSLACIIHFLYEAWTGYTLYNDVLASNEGDTVWVWDEWVAFAGSELMYVVGPDDALQTFPEPVTKAVYDQTRFKELGGLSEFLEHEYSALAVAQTVAAIESSSPGLWSIVQQGFEEADYALGLILPRPPNHEAPLPGDALIEAETEAVSKLSATMERMKRDDKTTT